MAIGQWTKCFFYSSQPSTKHMQLNLEKKKMMQKQQEQS